jgi:hypothetical protein
MAFAWMVIARYRLEVLRNSGEDKALDDALEARRAEGVAP